ncbi:MAG: hypothetical protein JW893_00630 [Candidatus Omnitrophica bacterium]|nr:hypothetical protein [Candidatus Omnitrophota bacterium]
MKASRRRIRVYDPDTGKPVQLEALIRRLGIQSLADKFDVSQSTVQKWRLGIHRPAKRTLGQSTKKLF